jgi:hypothetical protein
MVGTQEVQEQYDMQRVITRKIRYKAVSRNALKLDSQIISTYLLYCSCRLRLPNYVELISMYDPQRGSIDHTTPHRLDQNHFIPIKTIPSSQKRIPDSL